MSGVPSPAGMGRFRKLLAVAMSFWLLLSSGAAYALASLEAEHEQEHMTMGQQVHDAADHHHADTDLELFSQLFGQPGFDQLTSAWIASPVPTVAQVPLGVAPVQIARETISVTPFPPPGPPPRAAALNRGGRSSS